MNVMKDALQPYAVAHTNWRQCCVLATATLGHRHPHHVKVPAWGFEAL